jgi:2-polyprenyl-3-methyl-5-hydroxy-6-metoxy-1,4-benzoquinol methylase
VSLVQFITGILRKPFLRPPRTRVCHAPNLDNVRMAYRLFLNREAESNAVVEERALICQTHEELRHSFVSSAEFQGYLRSLNPELFRSIVSEFYSSYFQKPAAVDIDVPRDVLEILLHRVRAQWRLLGERDPCWSVLGDDDFRIKNMDAPKVATFYETGREAAHLIELFKERTGVVLRQGICLELGCGVGRVTAHLAQLFDRVIAIDISPENLRLCEQHVQKWA